MVSPLFDMNFLFRRWVSVLAKKNSNFLTNEDDKKHLIQNVVMSIYYDVHIYKGFIDNIIFCFDTDKASWRKFIEIKETETFYKKDRNKIFNFDYEQFIQCMVWFREYLQSKGICVLQIPFMEADDLLYLASEHLYKQGRSSVIITADSDMRQLLKSGDDAFIAIYNSFSDKKIHYVIDYVKEDESEIITTEIVNASEMDDIFLMDAADIIDKKPQRIKGLINNNSEIVDPFEVLMVKIFSGDKNDSVPSCYYKKNKTGDGYTSFGETNAANLYHAIKPAYKIDHDFIKRLYSDNELKRELAFKVINLSKSKEMDKVDSISDAISRNIKFVYLNKFVYTDKQYSETQALVEEQLDRNDLLNVSEGFPLNIFDGTKYEIGDISTRVYDSKERKY